MLMRYFQTNTSVTRGLDVWTAVVRKKVNVTQGLTFRPAAEAEYSL